MLQPRIIPVLLLQNGGLVKTVRFSNQTYIGDPINAVKIFNEKGADELVLIDLDASEKGEPANISFIEQIASEAFIPVAYGGGIRTSEHIERVVTCGVEKVIINSAAQNPKFISEAAKNFARSTLTISVDYKTTWYGNKKVCFCCGSVQSDFSVIDFCKLMEENGAGEILLHNISLDGTMKGYDLKTLESIVKAVSIPVVICGGAGNQNDLVAAINAGAAGAAAGSLFIYSGPHRAVLINYPDELWLKKMLGT